MFALCFLAAPSTSLPFLSPVFSSHMVLQRDRPNTIWGWTSPGAHVTVTISDRRAEGDADPSGKWSLRLSPPKVGGPYTLSVDGQQHVQLDDVLVGDVWICSGQSNMEMGIGVAKNAADEIAAANYPEIRLCMVQKDPSISPVQIPDSMWTRCTPQNMGTGWGSFSAAAYYFGRELNQRLRVPIGLVETCWGGTVAEAWTSRKGLDPFKEFQPAITTIDNLLAHGVSTAQKLDQWMRKNDSGSTKGDEWAATSFDDSGWKTSDSTSYEKNGLERFDGVVWFRKEIILPDPLPAGPVLIQLGYVDDMDTTWVNGTRVGEHYAVQDWRQYRIEPSLLKPGRNVITVRVLDTGGIGGLTTPESQILWIGDGTAVHLAGGWKFAVGADLTKSSALEMMYTGDPNVPTVLYNGMIAPLVPLAIKGAIWYQGESNAGRAAQYRRLLPAMITDWRRSFGQGDFPFFIVQIANFSTRHPDPVDDAWAELREAQTYTARTVRNAGLAVTIDIGEGPDIHPKDKQDVGLRLALSALHVAYGQNLPFSGPVFRSAHRDGATMRVEFDHTEGGLKNKGDRIAGFEIAGADHKFYWADARIDGNSLIVSAASVAEPVAVRYAWDTNPEATLYNGADLPAVPFRTDAPK